MSPDIILYGFLIFFVCLAIHMFIWRIKIPKNDVLMLFLVFLAIPSVIFLFFCVGNESGINFMPLLEVLLLHLSLSLVYISSYPAVQADSPSLYIILMIASSGRNRMTSEEIINMSSNTKLITDRVEDLVNYKLISKDEGCFKLRPIARVIIIFFIWYRKLLELPHHGG